MIVLYSTGCPVCKIVKAKLDQAGIRYETETNTDRMIELGIHSVPMLQVDGKLLTAGEAMKWIESEAKSGV